MPKCETLNELVELKMLLSSKENMLGWLIQGHRFTVDYLSLANYKFKRQLVAQTIRENASSIGS